MPDKPTPTQHERFVEAAKEQPKADPEKVKQIVRRMFAPKPKRG